jgi:uncharacterized membrane protein
MEGEIMTRFKNYALWVAVFAFLPILADSLEVYNIHLILPGNYDKFVVGLLGILVLAGFLNNPSIGSGFKDDK